jgi:hypothetical protein
MPIDATLDHGFETGERSEIVNHFSKQPFRRRQWGQTTTAARENGAR